MCSASRFLSLACLTPKTSWTLASVLLHFPFPLAGVVGMGRNEDVRFISASIKIPPLPKYHPFLQLSALPFAHHDFFFHIQRAKESIHRLATSLTRAWGRSHILCSSSLALTRPEQEHNPWRPQHGKEDAERVLISEVLIRNKDGEVLERADLEAAAAGALRFSRPNSALTVREVQEDVHRIIDSGVFCSCMPVAVDTRDGIRLVFQVWYFFDDRSGVLGFQKEISRCENFAIS